MLASNFTIIGNKMLAIRKRMGLTQAEVAEKAGLSDRTYADIERGTVNMRVDTLLRICTALHVTPNTILIEEITPSELQAEALIDKLDNCGKKERETALCLLSIYLNSIE